MKGCDYIFYKGTKVEVWQDVFDTEFIRIYKDKKVYNTRMVEGHRKDPVKREQKRIDDNFAFVEEQHRQATLELSKSKHLSNESYRKWNISAYKYNPSKHRYEFDEKLGRSADVPKYIKER